MVTATIVGAWPLIRWFKVSDLKARWQAEDEQRERSRGRGKDLAESIKEQLLRQREASRWSLAEDRRNDRRGGKPGIRPLDECSACEGLGLSKVSPPPEKGTASPGIVECTPCHGNGITAQK